MKTILTIPVLVLLLLVVAAPCFGMMGLEEVSKARAAELGLNVKSDGGPDDPYTWISIEFETKGELKDFVRVDLEVHEGGKQLVSSSLREERPTPGHVRVSFSVERARLDQITVRVVTGFPMNLSGHDLRLQDFVETVKGK